MSNSIKCDSSVPAPPPDFLRAIPTWVTWKFEPNEIPGKPPRKIPHYVTGGHRHGVQGAHEDRAKLATYESAIAAAKRQGMDGVGFAHLPGCGVVSLDLDKCIVDGEMHRDAYALLGTTYAEISPSGKGVRAFFKGELGNDKDSKHPDLKVEIFSTKGFVTFSGRVLDIVRTLGNENEVAAVSPEVRALVDQRFGNRQEARHVETSAERLGLTPGQIAECLDVLPLDLEYDPWIKVGMGLHHECGDDGFEAWHTWSKTSPRYKDEADCRAHWRSFGKNQGAAPVTARSLVHLANEHGARIDVRDVASPDEFVSVDSVAPPPPEVEGLPQFPAPFRGPMRAIVDATLRASPMPQPHLALLAALVGMAAGCSGVFALPDGMRLNLYGIGIADTGTGKDLVLNVGSYVAEAACATAAGIPGSGQGLEDALTSRAGLLVKADEIAHMLGVMNSKGAESHQQILAANLLKLFSASSGTYHKRLLAESKATSTEKSVNNPYVSLLGLTTAEKLGTSVGMGNVHDGLLGRMLCAFGDPDVTPRRVRKRYEMPVEAIQAGDAVRAECMGGEFASAEFVKCVDISPAADARFDALIIEFHQRAKSGNSSAQHSICRRSYEKCLRIAGVVAVWDNPPRPEVSLDHVEWAAQVVRASDDSMIRFTEMHMHAGDVQRNAALVVETVGKILRGKLKADRPGEQIHVENGRVPRSLVLRRSKLSADDLHRAVSHAIAAGDLVREPVLPEGSKRAVECYRL